MPPLSTAYWIAKGIGWDNVPRRLWHMLTTRSGVLRKRLDPAAYAWERFPNRHVSGEQRLAQWKTRRQKFFAPPSPSDLQRLVPAADWQTSVTDVCVRAVNGQYPFFSRWEGELGWPPNFNRDPVHQLDWPVGEHWLGTARSGPPRDDIKLVWEPSRCTLLIYLTRQLVYSGQPVWAERIWEFIDSWLEQNPVHQSVAWACGQETAFRLMAMLTAVMACLDLDCTTEARLQRFELLCWQSAKRIAANINYAISQENNHALSEAVGLWTVGLLFPEFPEAGRWTRQGRQVLEHEVARQVYPDGSYVQHSMSYHRVMLDDLCWAIELGRKHGIEFSATMAQRLTASTRWLGHMVNRDTGRVPNYGSNDGANVLPFSCSDYLDYRPTLQMAATVAGVELDLPIGPWSEKTCWIAGRLPTVSRREPIADHWSATEGGYFVLRGPASMLFTRATTYRDRPGQCDMLHVDLWYRHWNILRDAGSYYYYHADRETKNYYYSVAAHNTVQVAGAEQMTKGPSFLWFHWPTGRGEFKSPTELHCQADVATSRSYQHRRIISRSDDAYTIVDEVSGIEPFTARWRLAPELEWRTVDGGTIVGRTPEGEELNLQFSGAAMENCPSVTLHQSWESLYYGERSLCPSIELSSLSGRLVTSFWVRARNC